MIATGDRDLFGIVQRVVDEIKEKKIKPVVNLAIIRNIARDTLARTTGEKPKRGPRQSAELLKRFMELSKECGIPYMTCGRLKHRMKGKSGRPRKHEHGGKPHGTPRLLADKCKRCHHERREHRLYGGKVEFWARCLTCNSCRYYRELATK